MRNDLELNEFIDLGKYLDHKNLILELPSHHYIKDLYTDYFSLEESDDESDDESDEESEEEYEQAVKTKIFAKNLADEFLELVKAAGRTIECQICWNIITENLIITECSHKYCTTCFLKTNNNCSFCRKDLS